MSKLLLLPNCLGQTSDAKALFPVCLDDAVASLDGLIAESPQGGRSFLNKFRTKKPPYDVPLAILNEQKPHFGNEQQLPVMYNHVLKI